MKNVQCTGPAFFYVIFSFLLFTALSRAGYGQEADPTIFNLLYTNDMLESELEINLDSIMAKRRTDDRTEGIFRFTGVDGKAYQWQVEVNVRGRFRRTRCDFPPLMINFNKGELRAAHLDTHNNLKLITHCLDGPDGEEILLREYLVYQLYRTLTEKSYRTQLMKITYRNTANGKPFTRLSVLQEDEKELADRLDGELCDDCYGVPIDSFDQDGLAMLGLFQYMIGNIDWSAIVLRNVKLLKPHDGSPFFLVPYDFDFSAVVDPPYLIIPPVLDIRSIQQRRYLGMPQTAERIQEAYTRLLKPRQEELRNTIAACNYLNAIDRRDILRYIEDFFRRMDRSAPRFEVILNDMRRQK